MSTPHAPLPPEPPATLENVHAVVLHSATVIEQVAQRVERFDDRIAQLETIERSLQRLAVRLSTTAIDVAFSRTVSILAPPARWLAVVGSLAFLGGFAGTLLWSWLHSAVALAAVP